VGSRSKIHLAYIAGFLDGDGSLMLQVKKRSDTKLGIRFMATICLYQDTRHEKDLYWMRDVFNIGYVSKRKDGMSELRINGYKTVLDTLQDLQPFIRFKKIQTQALIKACRILKDTSISSLTKKQLKELVDLIFIIKNQNYSSQSTLSKEELNKRLGLTP
jgi:hypothetical protein